ncbi:CoA transferase [Streptomyces sp. R41]|uniref:CoA transferase n=1 Tax=Streptomyces sp. R41 TaxID=3238632 RepID=A0AB39RTS3_9ACTN
MRPFVHWKDALAQQRITYSLIQTPEEAAQDPQLRVNDSVVPLEGVSGLECIISGPVNPRRVPKVPEKRAPDLGEHNDEILAELGFGPPRLPSSAPRERSPARRKRRRRTLTSRAFTALDACRDQGVGDPVDVSGGGDLAGGPVQSGHGGRGSDQAAGRGQRSPAPMCRVSCVCRSSTDGRGRSQGCGARQGCGDSAAAQPGSPTS